MGLLDLLLLLLVAGVCGGLGRTLAGAEGRGGCIVSIVVGFIGALLGMWLARTLGLPELLMLEVGGTRFPIIWSIIGGALFSGVLGLLSRR